MQTQLIAITTNGPVAIMRVIVTAAASQFSPDAAAKNGFVLSSDKLNWSRVLDNNVVEDEISRSGFDPALGWRFILESDVPEDRTFRNAWRDSGSAVTEDLATARGIVRSKIREIRPDRLAALDNAMKPLEVKAALGTITAQDKLTLQDLETKRQRWRDAPADPAIDAAATVDDLNLHLGAL